MLQVMDECLQYVILHVLEHLNQIMRCECVSSARIRPTPLAKTNVKGTDESRKEKNEEETVLRRIPKESILSDYMYEVDDNTRKDTEYYVICLKGITEVTTYEHIRISEVDKENIPLAVLCRTANGKIRRAWESTRKFN